MAPAKRTVTFYIAEDVLRAREGTGRTDLPAHSEVVEKALRAYLGLDVVDRVWARSTTREKDVTELAVSEQHKAPIDAYASFLNKTC